MWERHDWESFREKTKVKGKLMEGQGKPEHGQLNAVLVIVRLP